MLFNRLISLISAAVLCCSVLNTAVAQRDLNLPSIGEPADRFLSPADERIQGARFYRSLQRQNAIVDDPEISQYLRYLGYDLLSGADDPLFSYQFFMVRDGRINAFAVPGGYIGINYGLFLRTRNENELAGVVAHEIAHVSQRHIARQIAQASASQVPSLGAFLTGLLLAIGGAPEAGTALIYAGSAASIQRSINFTRLHEAEADRVGIKILHNAGYDPRGMANFFQVLQQERRVTANSQFDFLRTHPLDINRISEANDRIARLRPQSRPDSKSYQYIKARIAALAVDDPAALAREIKRTTGLKTRQDRYRYAEALSVAREWDDAEAVLDELRKEDPESVVYMLALARIADQRGYIDKHLTSFKELHAIYPDFYPLTVYYADALRESGQPEACLNLLSRLERNDDPATLSFYRLQAECHADAEEPIASKQSLAEYYFRKGNLLAAATQLRDALRLKPTSVFVEREIKDYLVMIEEEIDQTG